MSAPVERPSDAAAAGRGGSRLVLALAILVILLDQLSKWWILAVVMQPPRIVPVTPFLNLVLARNPGISFGLLRLEAAWGPWLLSAGALAVVTWLVLWQRRSGSRLVAVAVGLVVGGAIGNVVDRVLGQAVTDFIDVYWGTYHWPAFNLADSAICIGVALLLAEALFSKGGSPNT